jgi:hypothetical protein
MLQEKIRYKGGGKPKTGGFATPHIPGVPEKEPDEEVNDSLGSVHPADTMDTDPDEDPETKGKGTGKKTPE